MMKGRWGYWIGLWCGAATQIIANPASADPAPAPAATPSPPAAAVAQPQAASPQAAPPPIDRHGPVLLGGITVEDGDTAWRLDAILPVPLQQAPRLRFGLILGYDHNSASIPGLLNAELYGATVTPAAYYDWRLPIASSAGDFVVSIEGGPSISRIWLKLDEQGMPASNDTLTAIGLHIAAAFQFRARGGFVGSAQLFGLNIPLNHPTASDPRWMVSTSAKYELAFMAGYQFR